MATITIHRNGEPIEVHVRRDGWGGVHAETFAGQEYSLNPREEDWALTVIDDDERWSDPMEGFYE